MRRIALLLLLVTSACASLTTGRPTTAELTARAWHTTLERARTASDSGRHAEADALLASFASEHVGSPEANETLYWRGLFRLDPANRTHDVADALAMLNAYLVAPATDSTAQAHRTEATILRRTALELERLHRAVATATAAAEAASRNAAAAAAAPRPADTSAKDEEITRLKKELEAATDELNRIKRRLSPGRP